MKLTSREEGDLLVVDVSIPLRAGKTPKLQIVTEDVVKELKLRGVEVKNVIKGVHLLNISDRRRTGVAIFEVFSEKENTPEVVPFNFPELLPKKDDEVDWDKVEKTHDGWKVGSPEEVDESVVNKSTDKFVLPTVKEARAIKKARKTTRRKKTPSQKE